MSELGRSDVAASDGDDCVAVPYVYRVALRLHPADFRRRYGADVLATIAAGEADRARRGFSARHRGRARELLALLRSAYGVRKRADRRRDVSAAASTWHRSGRSGGRRPGGHTPGFRAPQSPHRGQTRTDRPGGFHGMTNLMDDLHADIRHALRRLRRTPGFTLVAVVTLALGIGASTAIFSLVDGILIEPLPYPDSERLVGIWNEAPGLGIDKFELSDAIYLNYREGSASLEEIAILARRPQILTGGDEPIRVEGAEVTPSLFAVLQVSPALGRAFTEEEGAPQGAPAVILSDALWASRFGRDPDILGRRIEVSSTPREIVGIMPPDFGYPAPDTQLWTPLVVDEGSLVGHSYNFYGLGRLRDGIGLRDATIEMRSALAGIVERVPSQFPPETLERSGMAPILTTMQQDVVGDIGQVLWVLMGTVSLVLLIACANVANLFLVRAEGSQREVAVRSALGAGRDRIMRFYLTESALLGALGGAVGLLVAWGAIRVVVALDPGTLPRLAEVSINGAALGFALAASLGSVLAFGAFPCIRLRVSGLVGALRDGGLGATGGAARNRARHALVVAQVALALVLLVGSGLMLRSFAALRDVDPGFDPRGAMSMHLSLPEGDYPGEGAVSRFILEATERIVGLPGVVAAGTTSRIGLVGGGDMDTISIEEFPQPPAGLSFVHPVRVVSPSFFPAMGIPLIEGRLLDRRDSIDAAEVALVSVAFATSFWPDGSAIGKRVRGSNDTEWYTIVGVVGGIRDKDLQGDYGQTIYLPLQGHAYQRNNLTLVVRTGGNPLALLGAVREQIWEIDPDLAISAVVTLEQLVADSMARTTFTMVLLGIAAAVALLLGTIGIYGVIAYVVSQRTAEIGVRMALGAPAGDVSSMVVRQGLVVVAGGIGVGLVAALALTRVMSALLFEVSSLDPVTFAAVPVVLIAAGTVACLLPARRAAAVDPAVALRAE